MDYTARDAAGELFNAAVFTALVGVGIPSVMLLWLAAGLVWLSVGLYAWARRTERMRA